MPVISAVRVMCAATLVGARRELGDARRRVVPREPAERPLARGGAAYGQGGGVVVGAPERGDEGVAVAFRPYGVVAEGERLGVVARRQGQEPMRDLDGAVGVQEVPRPAEGRSDG